MELGEPARPVLRVVDENGELHDDCPGCAALADQLKGAERDINAWRLRYADLVRDAEAEAKADPLWDDCRALFDHWRETCRHPRARFTLDRFNLLRPWLKRYGPDDCRRAVDGAAFDAFETKRKNGSVKRHDGLGLIFRDAEHFEDFANRAPREL